MKLKSRNIESQPISSQWLPELCSLLLQQATSQTHSFSYFILKITNSGNLWVTTIASCSDTWVSLDDCICFNKNLPAQVD
jgi:hypothetical protein